MTQTILDKAYQHCIINGHRFTDPRADVLRILAEEAKPLGAYEILQRLSGDHNKPNPPTVYRAIQFWHQEGFVHCIDSLKAYVICSNGHHIGQTQFLICSQCDFVQELDSHIELAPVKRAAKSIRFSITNVTIEIKGLCAHCNS